MEERTGNKRLEKEEKREEGIGSCSVAMREGGMGEEGEILHSFTKIPLFLFSEGSPTEPETNRPMNRRIDVPKDRRFIECILELFVVYGPSCQFRRNHTSTSHIRSAEHVQRASLHHFLYIHTCRLAYTLTEYRNGRSLSNFDAWMKLDNARSEAHLSPPCPCLRLPWRYPLLPLLQWPY